MREVHITSSRGSRLKNISDQIANQGYNVEFVVVGNTPFDKQEKIVVTGEPTSRDSKDVVRIYLQVDERTRARRLAHSLRDKTVLRYIRRDCDYRTIPDVWHILLEDSKKFHVVKCDYMVNGNLGRKVTLTSIIKIVEKYVKKSLDI